MNAWLFALRPRGAGHIAQALTSLLMAILSSTASPARAQGETNEFIPPMPNWDRSLNLRASSGYNDNLLLSSGKKESSYLLTGGLDFTLLRLPVDGKEFAFFLSSDYTWYPQRKQVSHEQFGVALFRLKLALTPGWSAGLDLQYVYLDQVIDTSITETNPSPTLVRGHGVTLRPSVRRELPYGFWLEAKVGVSRWFYNAPLDSYWEGGPQLSLGRDYGFKSSASLSAFWTFRAYDTRQQVTLQGIPVPRTSLEFIQPEVEAALRHNFDSQRHWRSVTKFGALWNDDGHSDYFNFLRYQVSQQFRYVRKTWEIKAQGKFSEYDFTRQTTSLTDVSLRHKEIFGCGLRAEKKLFSKLKLLAEYSYERSLSNRPSDQYIVNKVSAGLDWEF